VLTSQIYDRISQAEPPETALICYCDYADKRTLVPCNVVRSLCQQSLRSVDVCPDHVLTKANQILSLTGDDYLEETVELLHLCLEVTKPQLIFLDGVDELSDRDQQRLFRTVYAIVNDPSNSACKLYIAGRENPNHIVRAPPNMRTFYLYMHQDLAATDVESFVRHSIITSLNMGALVCSDPLLPEQIIDALIAGSKGM
jgi:hypothetical protein